MQLSSYQNPPPPRSHNQPNSTQSPPFLSTTRHEEEGGEKHENGTFMPSCPISAQLVGFHRHGHKLWTKDGGRGVVEASTSSADHVAPRGCDAAQVRLMDDDELSNGSWCFFLSFRLGMLTPRGRHHDCRHGHPKWICSHGAAEQLQALAETPPSQKPNNDQHRRPTSSLAAVPSSADRAVSVHYSTVQHRPRACFFRDDACGRWRSRSCNAAGRGGRYHCDSHHPPIHRIGHQLCLAPVM